MSCCKGDASEQLGASNRSHAFHMLPRFGRLGERHVERRLVRHLGRAESTKASAKQVEDSAWHLDMTQVKARAVLNRLQ